MRLNETDRAVIASLQSVSPRSCLDIAAATGINRATVYRSLYKLKNAGRILNRKDQNQGSPDFFTTRGEYELVTP